MVEIIPAILASNLEAFKKRLFDIESASTVVHIQVDFADGVFVPNKTVMPVDLGVLNPRYQWEAHLMVENPEAYLKDVKAAGFNSVVVHYESSGNHEDLAGQIHDLGMKSFLAINPSTNVEKIENLINFYDGILVMSVSPGFQGREFLNETFDKVEKLKKRPENFIIEVDGGIKLEHVQKLKELGVNRLVIGSALVGDNFKDNFERFETEIQT